MLVKKLAGVVDIVQAAMIMEFAFFTIPSGSCVGNCNGLSLSNPIWPFFLVGLLLVADGAVSLLERWPAFPVAIILSLATIAEVVLNWGKIGGEGPVSLELSAAIALVTVVLNVRALMARPPVSEENHPLNLPVFG